MINRILIWGYGRVGHALLQGCLKVKLATGLWPLNASNLSVIIGSSKKSDENLDGVDWIPFDLSVAEFNSLESLPIMKGDLVIATVPDHAIENVAKLCNVAGVTFIHCSGATPIIDLHNANSGVFYPLQTFDKETPTNWSTVPVFLESANDVVKNALTDLCSSLQIENVNHIESSQREYLHMSAVFANNYTIAMAGIAHDLLNKANMNSDWIRPIMAQTAANLQALNPWDKLTGPAKRNDLVTMRKHESMLADDSALKQLYQMMSLYIQRKTKH